MAGAVVIIAGCVSTPAERIQKNPAAFNSWPPEIQANIRAGRIAVGYTQAQVRMALGDPDHVLTRTTERGTEEVWSYEHKRPRISLGLGVGGGGGGTFVGGSTAVSSGGPFPDEVLNVIFAGGVVQAIEQMR